MNIESIKRKLLVKYPLFGSVVANSNFIAESTLKTSGTDGKNIYYNPNFAESITEEQKIFLFAHEICHIAFDHISRSKNKDEVIWNTATDAVINAFLSHDGLPLIEGAVDIPEAINYDAEEMYKKLLEEKIQQSNKQDNVQKQNKNHRQQSQSQSYQQGSSHDESSQNQQQQLQEQCHDESKESSQKDVGHDTHSMWNKKVENMHRKEQSQSNFRQTNSKLEDKRSLLDRLRKMLGIKKKQQENHLQLDKKNEQEEKNEAIKKLGEKETFKQNKVVRKKQLEELRQALASRSYDYGHTTNSEIRNITNIGTSKALVDWRRLLKEAVKRDVDWSYQNAGIEDGVVTAHLEECSKPETEIVLDTSGSINETLLKNFLRECKSILQTSKVKVGCFDTQFYGFTEIRNAHDIDNLPFNGNGGTDFDVAVNAFTKRVENKIIFTDGDANMPRKSLNVIWVVFGSRKINPAGGKVIHIDDEQLKRLLTKTDR